MFAPKILRFHLLLQFVYLSAAKITEYDLMPQLFQFDNYKKCIFHSTNGTYCLVTVQLHPEDSKNVSRIWKIIEEISSDRFNYRHDLLRHGLCIEQASNTSIQKQLNRLYEEKYKEMGLVGDVVSHRCETEKSDYQFGTMDTIFAVLIVLYMTFVILVTFSLQFIKATSAEKYKRLSKTLVGHFFSSFSISTNWKFMTKIDPKKYKQDFVASMQGMRFICTTWIIYVHTAQASLASPLLNPEYAEEAPSRFITSYHTNGGILVQIFFVLSSWLLTVSLLEKLKKSKNISFGYVLLYIFSRYFRLVPLVMFVVALQSTLLVHTFRGPFWDLLMGEEYRICRRKWWENVLFINNFGTSDGICMIQSWYLSADFQLFVIFVLILWLIQKKLFAIYIATGLAIVAYTIGVFGVLFWNGWEISIKFTPETFYNFQLIRLPHWNFVWASTYAAVPGFAVGLLFGYIFWQYKDQKLFQKQYQVVLMWIICIVLVPGVVLSYSYYLTTDYYSNSRLFAAIFGSLSKTLFASGIALMLLGMSQRLGGFIRKMFEFPFFHVMAQLSYAAFVVHFTVIRVNVASRMALPYVSDYVMFQDVITNNSVSYLISLGLTLFVQMPFTVLSKKMMMIM